MKRFLTYLFWSLLTVAFVFASIAIPVALAENEEKEMVDQVVVVQADEAEELHLSRQVSFADQVAAFANADLNVKIPRNAYPTELSTEDILEKTNDFLRVLMEAFRLEVISYINPSAPGVETLLENAAIQAILYESPSGAGKVAYWNITYQWSYDDRTIISEESWPISSIVVNCDTSTGSPLSVEYSYLPIIYFSEDCGIQAYAEALGLGDKLGPPYEYHHEDAREESYAITAEWKQNLCYTLNDEEYCIMKSTHYPGEGRGRILLIPNSMIE